MTTPEAILALIDAFGPGVRVVRTTQAVRDAVERLARERAA